MERRKLIDKEKRSRVTVIICAVLLGIYPFYHANWGIDLMDAGYGLGNFFFFKDMDINWKLATFLSNVLGAFLIKLPGGDTYFGMNLYTSALLAAVAVLSYLFLVKCFKHPVLLLVGEWIALSLCWAPTTILYHYLGYYLITLSLICIELAIRKDYSRYFILAGFLLGINIFVRMPNVTHMACILVVWFDALFLYKGTEKWRKLIHNTGICIVGYLIGIGVPFAFICLQYKFEAYIVMIQWLFGMTETATDYKPTSMVSAMFGDYIQYAIWLVFILFYLLAGILLFRIQKGKYEKIKKTCYVLGIPVMLRFFYGRGMFGFDYQSYFSIYKWIVVFLLVFWMLAVWYIWQSGESVEQLGLEEQQADTLKRLTLGTMVIVMITPLGSNNGLYPIINNLFLPAPITLYLGYLFIKKYQSFAIKARAYALTVCILIQTTMFGTHFVFHDAAQGQKIDTEITRIPSLCHMKTTSEKASELEALYQYVAYQKLQNRQIMLYGDIPALSYILSMKPAIFTTWADLGSNTHSQLVSAIHRLDDNMKSDKKSERPVVIVSAAVGACLTDDPQAAEILGTTDTNYDTDPKLATIRTFLTDHNYTNTYCNTAFMVFE